MGRVQARRQAAGWLWALAGALVVHALAWWLLRTRYVSPPAADARPLWHATLRTAAPPPGSTPAPEPATATAPETMAPAPAPQPRPPQPVAERATPPKAPPPTPIARAAAEPPAPRPAPPTPPPEPAPPAPPAESRWLDATKADRAPAPRDNRWLLAPEQPWPTAFPKLRVKIWVSATGRIERFEIEGPAAADPAVQALFAPLPDTPMLPARIGRVPVPSTMRIELWAGDEGPAPDFVAPLAASAGDP